jgi:hypothetical protein
VPMDLPEPPKLRERILAAELVVVGTVAALVEVTKVEGFEGPRLAGFFEIQVERVLLGEPAAQRVLVRVLGDGPEDDPTWTSDLTPDARRLLILSPDVGPDLPENLFAPYFSSAFDVDQEDRVLLPADVLDDESRGIVRPAGGRASLDRIQALVDGVAGERAERERELEGLIPPRRVGRYPEVEEMPAAAVPTEGPFGPPGPALEPEVAGGRAAKLEGAEPARRARRRREPQRRRRQK